MKLKFGLMLLALSINVANAGLISVDDLVLGDGKITRDTNAQLEWLDLDLTANLSWNAAESSYAAFGFSHATVAQVESLFISAGISGIDTGTSAVNYTPSVELQDLITCRSGFNSTTSSSLCTSYAFTALDSSGRSELSWINRNDTLGVSTVIANSNNFIGTNKPSALDTYHHTTRSHWMVRSIEVPEPTSFSLAVLGLLSLSLVKRRTNKNQ
ncbi:hypothetical protein [Alkalimarinus coralli]|uniref:hypothetical protein n=1 Tax=Alkalimarinus coralli TaxID=2935863 RepID=UPI00202B5D7B|nr:hypothetical protein [Alkalimarinus coralli]